jgi:hypothetical protein
MPDAYTDFPYTRCSLYGLVYLVRIFDEYIPYTPVYVKNTGPYIPVYQYIFRSACYSIYIFSINSNVVPALPCTDTPRFEVWEPTCYRVAPNIADLFPSSKHSAFCTRCLYIYLTKSKHLCHFIWLSAYINSAHINSALK